MDTSVEEAQRGDRRLDTNLVTVAGGVFCLIGGGLALLAWQHVVDRRRFLRGSAVAEGVVVALRENRDGTDVQTSFYPRIRFHTASGREVTFESAMASGGNRWRIGDPVSVRYRVDHPETAECDDRLALWGASMLFALLAGAFLGVGCGLLFGLVPL